MSKTKTPEEITIYKIIKEEMVHSYCDCSPECGCEDVCSEIRCAAKRIFDSLLLQERNKAKESEIKKAFEAGSRYFERRSYSAAVAPDFEEWYKQQQS